MKNINPRSKRKLDSHLGIYRLGFAAAETLELKINRHFDALGPKPVSDKTSLSLFRDLIEIDQSLQKYLIMAYSTYGYLKTMVSGVKNDEEASMICEIIRSSSEIYTAKFKLNRARIDEFESKLKISHENPSST